MYKTFSLNKKVRLLTLNDFAFVFQKPKKNKLCGISLFSRLNKLKYPRIGLAISKKYIKHAHERNRIKRYARETFRLNQNNLLKKDFVITVFSKEVIYINNHVLINIFEQLWYCHVLLN